MESNTEFLLEFEKPLRDLQRQLQSIIKISGDSGIDVGEETAAIIRRIDQTERKIYSSLTPWQRVQLSRHPKRPYSLDYIKVLFEDFQELHGDRVYGDDQALIGGTAFFQGSTCDGYCPAKG